MLQAYVLTKLWDSTQNFERHSLGNGVHFFVSRCLFIFLHFFLVVKGRKRRKELLFFSIAEKVVLSNTLFGRYLCLECWELLFLDLHYENNMLQPRVEVWWDRNLVSIFDIENVRLFACQGVPKWEMLRVWRSKFSNFNYKVSGGSRYWLSILRECIRTDLSSGFRI